MICYLLKRTAGLGGRNNSNNHHKKFITIGVLVAAGIVISAVAIGYRGNGISKNEATEQTGANSKLANTQSTSTAASGNKLALSSLLSDGSPLRGDPNAPITLVEFGDFQCPNCARFATNTEPQLEKEYFDTGKVNMVFKHVPIYGPDSLTAAMAAQCAADQGKFWQFHDLLYNNRKAENSGWASAENMKKFASELGLDRTKFDSCLDSGKYKSLVENDFAFAREMGVSGTPSFIIVKHDGSEPEGILGAQPLGSFKAVLDKKLGSGA
jgi:protein-disulfide isomerase